MITLSVRRLPLINQRLEYNEYRRLIRTPEFRAQFAAGASDEFHCGKFVWAGVQEGSTILVQRILLSLEARIPGLVTLELSGRGKLTARIIKKLRDPFRLRGNGTADCYYNLAPGLIDPSLGLQTANPPLWTLVETFYRDFRNPIFHGCYISDLSPEKLDEIFSVFDEVQEWCDSWCNVVTRLNEISRGLHGKVVGKTA